MKTVLIVAFKTETAGSRLSDTCYIKAPAYYNR